MHIFLDFESYYANKYTLTGLTYPEYILDDRWLCQGVGIAIDDGEIEYYPEHEVEAAIADLPLEEATLVGQNLMFDATVLALRYNRYAKHYVDTQSLGRGMWPGQDVSLEAMCQRAWPDDPDMQKGKELANFKNCRELDAEQQAVMGNYCKQDVRLTRALFHYLRPNIPDSEVELAELTLRMYIQPRFILDRPLVEDFLEKELSHTKQLIKDSGLAKTTLSSNPKFAEWMRENGIEVPRKVSPSTGKETDALGQKDPAFLATMADYPEFAHVWKARAAVKSTLNTTRAQRLLDLDDQLGRIPVPLSFYGAHTGRWSGTQKVNLQNLPRGGDLRKALTAPPGYKVHVADSSNIEARVLAYVAGETSLLEMIRRKEDIYNDMATKIYGYPVDRKAKDADGNKLQEEEGNVGKTARLGLGYGMGAPKFRGTLASGPMGSPPILVSQHFAQTAVDTFRADSPNIVNYWRLLTQAGYDMMLPKTDYWIGPIRVRYERLEMPNGMALKYPNLRVITDEQDGRDQLVCDRRNGKTQRIYGGILAENIVQALSRTIVADQIRAAVREFPDSYLVLAVHDEIVMMMPDDNSDDRQARLEDLMRVPPDWAPDLPLDSEGGWDTCYSK